MPGNVLVAVILVREPAHVGSRCVGEQRAGVVGELVVGVGDAHRHEHRRRPPLVDHGRERVGDLVRARALPLLEVLVVDEVEPHRIGVEHLHRGAVLFPADRDDVVAGAEAAERVPFARRIGIRGRPPGTHGHDGRSRVAAQQVRGAERGVVEVR